MENAKTWVEYLTAIGSIATPIVVLLLTAVGWKYRQAIERKLKLEERLRDDRIEIYNKILEPYIIMLTPDTAWQSDNRNKDKNKFEYATSKMLSLEYRNIAFKLSLIGSDSVYKAYCDLMQHSFNSNYSDLNENEKWRQTQIMMSLLSIFLLEVRKSMGNETTKVDKWKMLEWFISDIQNFRNSNI